MSLPINTNLMLNTLQTSSALLGNSLNGMNNLNSGLGLGINSLALNGGLNSQALNSLGFGLSGVGNFGFNLGLLSNPNNLINNPGFFANLGLCPRCTTQCPSGTSCNNGVCRAFKLQGYIPNPNHVRVYRNCDGCSYYHGHRRRKHH